MKETKVYVDELPESCFDCHCCSCDLKPEFIKIGDIMYCNLLKQKFRFKEERKKLKDCPLQSLKTHDRELVKEVCEKIREFCENNKYRCNKYFLLYSIGLNVKLLNKNKEGQKETFYEFLDQIQKEYEK